MRKATRVALTAAALAVCGVALLQHERNARFSRLVAFGPTVAAREIWLSRMGDLNRCEGESDSGAGWALIDALELLEAVGNPKWQPHAERMVFESFAFVGAAPPNLSYGPLQIRLTKYSDLEPHNLRGIFDRCNARRIAWRILTDDTDVDLAAPALPREKIELLAACHNGQSPQDNRNAERALSHRIFRDLAYSLYLEAHFRRGRR